MASVRRLVAQFGVIAVIVGGLIGFTVQKPSHAMPVVMTGVVLWLGTCSSWSLLVRWRGWTSPAEVGQRSDIIDAQWVRLTLLWGTYALVGAAETQTPLSFIFTNLDSALFLGGALAVVTGAVFATRSVQPPPKWRVLCLTLLFGVLTGLASAWVALKAEADTIAVVVLGVLYALVGFVIMFWTSRNSSRPSIAQSNSRKTWPQRVRQSTVVVGSLTMAALVVVATLPVAGSARLPLSVTTGPIYSPNEPGPATVPLAVQHLDGGVTCDGHGHMIPWGGARLNTEDAPDWPYMIVRACVVFSDGSGGWILDERCGIHNFGRAWNIVADDIYRHHVNPGDCRGVAVTGYLAYFVLGDGTIVGTSGTLQLGGGRPIWPKMDMARALQLHVNPSGVVDGAYILDRTGGVTAVDEAPAVDVPRIEQHSSDADWAVGFVILTRSSGYVMDSLGRVFAWGAPLSFGEPPPPLLASPVARGMSIEFH